MEGSEETFVCAVLYFCTTTTTTTTFSYIQQHYYYLLVLYCNLSHLTTSCTKKNKPNHFKIIMCVFCVPCRWKNLVEARLDDYDCVRTVLYRPVKRMSLACLRELAPLSPKTLVVRKRESYRNYFESIVIRLLRGHGVACIVSYFLTTVVLLTLSLRARMFTTQNSFY